MTHALTLYEAAEIHANGELTFERCMEVVAEIAPAYDVICCYVEDRIRFLTRHAGKPFRAGLWPRLKPEDFEL